MLRARVHLHVSLIVFLISLVSACAQPPQGIVVSAQEYGAEWPFPEFEAAELRCENRPLGGTTRPLVTVKLGETWYGLNGAAMGVGGYPDAREKMARHLEFDSYELGASPQLIERGLAICG